MHTIPTHVLMSCGLCVGKNRWIDRDADSHVLDGVHVVAICKYNGSICVVAMTWAVTLIILVTCLDFATFNHFGVRVWIDIEETDIESESDRSADDLTTIDDTSMFFSFGFSSSKTDSLPFTVHDTDSAVTRKSQRVRCYYLYLDVLISL